MTNFVARTAEYTKALNIHEYSINPDSKVHGSNMGPIWGRQDPGGPHVGPTNFAIWEYFPRCSRHLAKWSKSQAEMQRCHAAGRHDWQYRPEKFFFIRDD